MGLSQGPLTDNTEPAQGTDINGSGRIWTCNPSKRVATHPRLRPYDHWDRLEGGINESISIFIHLSVVILLVMDSKQVDLL